MISITKNEAKIINFLIKNFISKNSIREIGRQTGLSAMGTQKILKGLEKQKIAVSEKIGGAIYYRLNLENKSSQKLAELVLTQYKLNSYAQIYAEDLIQLKGHTKACILYGSILTKGEKAEDVDIMVIIEKKNLEKAEKICQELSRKGTKEIHMMVQTEKDFESNIKKKDKPILDIIKKGAVLWGENYVVEGVKNAED